jgi:hypothetical protein
MARGSAQSTAATDFLVQYAFVDSCPDFHWQGYQPVRGRPQYDESTADLVLATASVPSYVSEDLDKLDLSAQDSRDKTAA